MFIYYYYKYNPKLSDLNTFSDNNLYQVIKTPENEMKYKYRFYDNRDFLYISIVINFFLFKVQTSLDD